MLKIIKKKWDFTVKTHLFVCFLFLMTILHDFPADVCMTHLSDRHMYVSVDCIYVTSLLFLRSSAFSSENAEDTFSEEKHSVVDFASWGSYYNEFFVLFCLFETCLHLADISGFILYYYNIYHYFSFLLISPPFLEPLLTVPPLSLFTSHKKQT